jgi:hypothetical protein
MKFQKLIAFASISSLLMGAAPLVAASKGPAKWQLPDTAVQVDSDVFYLGKKKDPQNHQQVEGFAFVHRSNDAKNKGGNGGTSTCYSFLANGAKWKGVAEPWVMNPANTSNLDQATLFAHEGADISKWEDATDGNVNNGNGVDVMGNGTQTTNTLTADSSSPDGNNEIYFADIQQNGVIAVTTVWGIFGGPTQNRVLTEWDQVFDDVSFNWSLTGETSKMDFDNIATHEIGHAVGLGHPGNTCTNETMYAYADNGETKKRDLNSGDITGINLLY